MDAQRWRRIEDLFSAAVELPSEDREPFVARECADDTGLREQVIRLLHGDRAVTSSLRGTIGRAADELLGSEVTALLGTQIGPWQLRRFIAQGGMGAVYLAERTDGEFEQRVAIKLLAPGLVSTDALTRFASERRILASLDHPHVARLLDGGTTPAGMPYLAMEYIEGRPIDVSCREQRLSGRARLELFRKVCGAVAFAHQNLVVHRDIKPSNILVTGRGEPKLLDFGVAKLVDHDAVDPALTVADLRALTPRYASPEQLKGERITTATDVYSLGVLLYELLTDRFPYSAFETSPQELHRAICEQELPRPSTAIARTAGSDVEPRAGLRRLRREIAGDLDNIVLMAVRKEPGHRYASVALLAEDIERYLQHLPVRARAAGLPYRAGRFLRRHRAASAATAAVVITLLGLGALHTTRLAAERDRALRAEASAAQEADMARAVTEFLLDTFQVVDPASPVPARDIAARELLDRAAADLEANAGRSRAVSQRLAATMSRAYSGLGLPVPARKLAERAVREIEAAAAGGGDSRELAEALAALARASLMERRSLEARGHAERALAIYERLTGPRSPEAGRTHALLALIYYYLDAREEQLRSAERAVAILREARGPGALETIDAIAQLAIAHRVTGRLERSITLAKEAREGYVRILGPAHIKISDVLFTLAVVSFELGRYREALAYGKEEVAVLTAALGPNDPRLARPHRLMGANYEKLGDIPSALREVRRAITIGEGSPPPLNRDSLNIAYGNLGKLLIDEGFLDEAEPWLGRQRQLLNEQFGPDHSTHSYNQMFFGILARKRGDYAAARRHLDEAIALDLLMRPAGHPEVQKKRLHRAYVEHAAGNHKQAATDLEDVLATLERSVGSEHPLTAQTRGYLAEAYGALGRHDEAEALFREGLAGLESGQGRFAALYREALQAYADFVVRARGREAARPIYEQLAQIGRERIPLKASDIG